MCNNIRGLLIIAGYFVSIEWQGAVRQDRDKEAIQMLKAGMSQTEVAKTLGVHKSSISRLANKKQ